MGQVLGKDPVVVTVSTGDVKSAGTDNDMMIRFIDVDGNGSKNFKLDNLLHDDFERGSTDQFVLPEGGEGLGEISCIEIWREGFLDDDLFLNVVFIKRLKTEQEAVFPIHRWIPMADPLRIRRYDSFLPQHDPDPAARRHELEWKRQLYGLQQKQPGNIVQWDLESRKGKLFLLSKMQQIRMPSKWTTIADMKKIYTKVLPPPKSAEEDWHLKDECFAEQRLAGCNPQQIKLCTAIPSNFAVTSGMIEPFLEGNTMGEALEKKRLFLTDYAVLKDLNITKRTKELAMVAPLGLFYLSDTGKLLPVAIQLQQDPQDDNPVFLPSDPPYTWTMAKMWFNLADACMHQAKAHLGFSHHIAESVCVVTHRQLSPSHPVFKLLAPHFLFLMVINHRAIKYLSNPGNWIDKTMTMGHVGTFDIIRRTLTTWRMDVEGTLPADIQDRGVGPDVLPHYPYRDDAMPIYDIIKDYVRDVIVSHYDSEETLTGDYELQAWAEEMTRPIQDGGAGLQGVPGGGKLTNTEDLIDIATFTIFTSSVQHAAVNFNQYDQYGFPAFYPTSLYGKPPTTKAALSEADMLDALPTSKMTAEVMLVAAIVSDRGTNALGDFEVQYGYDDVAQKALKKFQEDLKKAREGFLERNSKRQYSYTILDPADVPNAISI